MLSGGVVRPLRGVRYLSDSNVPAVFRKSIEEVLGTSKQPTNIQVSDAAPQAIDVAGVPVQFVGSRRVRVYRPAREATQSGWGGTKGWKIEVDNMQRWDNPLIGWSSTGDPLSNISMAMDFACKEDAIRFCEKYKLNYEVIEPNERKIKPKSYAENFSWNKRTRITNK